MLIAIRRLLQQRRHRVAIRNIRECFDFFGRPVDHLTDEELEVAALRASRTLTQLGISATEAADNLRRAVRASAEGV